MPIPSSDKVIKALTAIYLSEVGAVGIYMDQHARCAADGLATLAKRLEEDAIEEMKHAEDLMERILFFGGKVKYDKHDVPPVDTTAITDMLRFDVNLELRAIKQLSDAITLCFQEGDHGSRILLEKILIDEERHLGEYETMLDNLERYGDSYIVGKLM